MQDLVSFRKPLDLVMQADLQGPDSQGVHSAIAAGEGGGGGCVVSLLLLDLATSHLPSKHHFCGPRADPELTDKTTLFVPCPEKAAYQGP